MVRFSRPLSMLIVCLVFLAVFVPVLSVHAVDTGFEGYDVGTLASELSIPGVTFSGSPANQWVIYPGGSEVNGVFSTVSGYILIDPVTTGASTSSLEIVFDAPQSSVSFKYVAGPAALPAGNISATAFLEGVAGFNGALPLAVPPGGNYYEGEITIPGPLDRVVLTSDQPGFGIDDLETPSLAPVLDLAAPVETIPDLQINSRVLPSIQPIITPVARPARG